MVGACQLSSGEFPAEIRLDLCVLCMPWWTVQYCIWIWECVNGKPKWNFNRSSCLFFFQLCKQLLSVSAIQHKLNFVTRFRFPSPQLPRAVFPFPLFPRLPDQTNRKITKETSEDWRENEKQNVYLQSGRLREVVAYQRVVALELRELTRRERWQTNKQTNKHTEKKQTHRKQNNSSKTNQ